MKHRLYLAGPLQTGQRVELAADRAHYLTRVLRQRRGGELICFDGHGTAWRAAVEDDRARTAAIRLLEVANRQAPPEPRLHLVQGLLKGNAMDQVMQKATELGVTDLWPIQAQRTNVSGDEGRLQRRLGHWQRVIESACEQCGQLHLPLLHDPRALSAFLQDAPAARLIVLSPNAAPLPVSLPQQPLALLIGPEGGWTATEVALAQAAGAEAWGLGPLVLRAETAPLAAIAAIRHGWGWG
jgi:16S rRNA (uracil1498-N3)-methyltransferase